MPNQHPARVDDAEFTRMHNAGASNAELAQRFGIKQDSVRGVRQRLDLTGKPCLSDDPKIHEAVRRLQAQGYTRPEIAKELGISLDTASRVRRKAGIPRFAVPPPPRGYNPKPPVSRESVRFLAELGRSDAEIGEQLGVSKRTVSRVRQELGIKYAEPAEPYPQEIRDKARAMLEEGMSYAEVGRTLGIPRYRIGRWFPGMGWSNAQASEYRQMMKQMNKLDPPKDRY